MQFPKNIQFTQHIKIEGQLREFNFHRSNNCSSKVFTVDTLDSKGSRIIFSMHERDQQWKIQQTDLHAWIRNAESSLQELIVRELAVQPMYFSASRIDNPSIIQKLFYRLRLS